MATGAVPKAAEESFRRFENSEKEGTQMEGTCDHGFIGACAECDGAGQVPVVDHEAEAFRAELQAGMPEGEALGMAEARVDYLLERIGQEQERIDRINAAASARIEMIRQHAEDEAAKVQRRIGYVEALIRAQLPGDGATYKKLYGKKSVSLAHGEVGFRVKPAGIEITDKGKALAFAEKNGLPIKVEKSVGKTALKEFVMRAGEDPNPGDDGFEFVPASESFYVSPALPF